MEQLSLLEYEEPGIQEKFEEFDREHPEVYQFILGRTLDLWQRGFQHYGIKSIFELCRWHFHVEKGDNEFKLNNNYHSRYARKVMKEHPELEGFFETRKLKERGNDESAMEGL